MGEQVIESGPHWWLIVRGKGSQLSGTIPVRGHSELRLERQSKTLLHRRLPDHIAAHLSKEEN